MARAFDPAGLAEVAVSDHRQRAWRMLMLWLALSVALHLAMLIELPGFAGRSEPLKARILNVVVQREAMPPVVVNPATETAPAPLSHNISAITKARHVVEPVRKPEAEPARPALMAVAARDSVPVEAASAKQDEARSPLPTAGITATAHNVAAAATSPAFNAGYLHNPPPPYPLVARRNGEQGTVILRVRVTRNGMPASVDIEKPSGSSHLDDAALETVRTWRFVPARQNGQPVEARVLVPVVFKLEGTS
jgi:periplasmic protein TonB